MEKYSLKNVWAYLQGNFRYKLYYSKSYIGKKLKNVLISKHILEQIDTRISSMDKECYEGGQCKICGCKTTALQMANKSCDKPCYPVMLSKEQWNFLKEGGTIYDKVTDKFWTIKKFQFKEVKAKKKSKVKKVNL